MLIKYLRNEHGVPFGCVVATDKDQVGFSVCNPKDRFSKTIAVEIASGRAKTYCTTDVRDLVKGSLLSKSDIVLHELDVIESRAQRFFKNR